MTGQVWTITAIALSSGLLAIAAPIAPNASGAGPSPPHLRAAFPKGDRLGRVASPASTSVGSVEISGPAFAFDIVMRDRAGSIVFQSEQGSRRTAISKHALIAHPASVGARSASNIVPSTAIKPVRPKRSIPVGCERLVSALTRSTAAAELGRCIT